MLDRDWLWKQVTSLYTANFCFNDALNCDLFIALPLCTLFPLDNVRFAKWLNSSVLPWQSLPALLFDMRILIVLRAFRAGNCEGQNIIIRKSCRSSITPESLWLCVQKLGPAENSFDNVYRSFALLRRVATLQCNRFY